MAHPSHIELDDALIVGAGLAGSLLAGVLRGRGTRVDVIDNAQTFDERAGAGILITGNGTRALTTLGIRELDTAAARITQVEICDQDEGHLGTVDCTRPGWPPFLSFRHSLLRRLLLQDCQVRHGLTVDSINHERRTSVTFSDGSTQSYDLVVGADGVHSRVRRLLFGQDLLNDLDQYSGYRFVADLGFCLPHPTTYIGNGLTLLLVPLPNGETYCGAGPIVSDCLKERGSAVTTLKETFRHFSGAAARAIASIDTTTNLIPSKFWNLQQPTWVKGCCLLIGDAAHAMPPTISQGGSMAFEDVLVLLTCIEQNDDISRALLDYESRRRPRVEFVQHHSLQRIGANDYVSPRAETARRFAMTSFAADALGDIWDKLANESP